MKREAPALLPRAARIAEAIGGPAGVRWLRAPGSLHLMGGDAVTGDGLSLSVAIDRDCVIASRPRDDSVVRVRSLDVESAAGGVVEIPADGSEDPRWVEPAWGRYVAGLVRALTELGRPPVGLEAVLSSAVPLGTGLGSSAALTVACALALCAATGHRPHSHDLARVCCDAEHFATGVACRKTDPFVSLSGRAGCALLVDPAAQSATPVQLPGVAMLAVQPGFVAGADAAPKKRAAGFEAGDAVIEEARVRDTARAIAAGDRPALATLFAESDADLRDDGTAPANELRDLVRAFVDAGAIAARMTGAHSGASVVALTEHRRLEHVAEEASASYRTSTGREPAVYVCRAAQGAGPVAPDGVA